MIKVKKKNSNYHSKKIKGRKKKGFTLIEVIAVIAIIGIMASILLPKFTNYINEAKKLKVVEQSRKVLMAVESYNMKATNTISMDDTVNKAKETPGVVKYFENINDDTNKLLGTMKIKECYDVVNGSDFSIDANSGMFLNIGDKNTSHSAKSGSKVNEDKVGEK